MPDPFISCLCPTYKRPEALANAIACFLAQSYQKSELIVLDDAGQYNPSINNRVALISIDSRYPNLPTKFNAISRFSQAHTDIYAIWEDDDVYLPNHLEQLAHHWISGKQQYFAPKQVLSNYGVPHDGSTNLESAAGRFHASWAYSRPLWDALGGYHYTNKLIFDQQMGKRASDIAGKVTHYDNPLPTYVYRWGSCDWNGSQAGDTHYESFWDKLGAQPFEYIKNLQPEFDTETKAIYNNLFFDYCIKDNLVMR